MPASWKKRFPPGTDAVDALRVGDTAGGIPGWCTAPFGLDSPEIEVLCGGINTKGPDHAGVWRQGNLLHFGFEPAPKNLNEAGRALLINSIEYISRFTEDRPLARIPSPLSEERAPATRRFLRRALGLSSPTAEGLSRYLEESLAKRVSAMTDDEAVRWATAHMPYLRNEGGKLIVDEPLKELDLAIDAPDFADRLAAALTSSPAVAARIAARAIPEGPGGDATPGVWQAWLKKNARYLYFAEGADFTWRIDPLARGRGVPTTALRGPARADRKQDGGPEGALDEVEALEKKVHADRNAFMAAYGKAKTDAERAELVPPKPEDYAVKFMELGRKHAGTPAAARALAWVVAHDRSGKRVDGALETLLAAHVEDAALAPICRSLGSRKSRAALEKILDRNEHREVRGRCLYHLALTYRTSDEARSVRMLEEVAAKYADLDRFVGFPSHGKLGPQAEKDLYEIRHLSIGKTAPEIEAEDLDGVSFKLSDYRGKVVLLDFWGHW